MVCTFDLPWGRKRGKEKKMIVGGCSLMLSLVSFIIKAFCPQSIFDQEDVRLRSDVSLCGIKECPVNV